MKHPIKASISLGLLLAIALMVRQPESIISPLIADYGKPMPMQTQPVLIADALQGDDPHGPDPHDEIHDKALPSNQAAKDRKPTDDVYGGHELDERKASKKIDDDRFAADPRRN
jgi:hypothetical protein